MSVTSVTVGIDVAKAHVLGMTAEDAQGRYICANTTRSMREVVELLLKNTNRWDHVIRKYIAA